MEPPGLIVPDSIHRLSFQRPPNSLLFTTSPVAGPNSLTWRTILNSFWRPTSSKRLRFGLGLWHITHAYRQKRAVGLTVQTGSCPSLPHFRVSRPFWFQGRPLSTLSGGAVTGMVIHGFWGPTACISREPNLTGSPLVRYAVFAFAERIRVRFAVLPLRSVRHPGGIRITN